MTNLNEEQQAALLAVEVEKQRFDTKRIELEAQFKNDLATIQTALAASIRGAQDIGVPTRRIAFEGLGTTNAALVTTILGGAKLRPKRAKVEEAEPARVLTAPAVHPLDDGIYIVTEPSGTEWEFWGIDLGGEILMERSDSTGRGVDSEVPAPAAVIAAMKQAVPRADFSALLEED